MQKKAVLREKFIILQVNLKKQEKSQANKLNLYLKKLVTDDKIPLPYSTFTRMIKYIRYGYLPCMETKQKIVNALRETTGELTDTSFYDGMD